MAGGLDAVECRFDDDGKEWRITHVPSRSYFLIEGDGGSYDTTAVVGDTAPWGLSAYTWGTVPERVQRWAAAVKTDVDTPDLWAEVRRRQDILTGGGYGDVENTAFSPHEQTQISEQLREFKELLRSRFSLTAAQTLSLNAKLDALAAAAGRVGRKDWSLMFGGAVLAVLMEQLLPLDAVWGLLDMFYQRLGQLFSGDGLPQLPPMTPPPGP